MESLDRSNIKKILLTTTGLSSVGQGGGISSYVHDLATNFVNKGYKVTVYLVRQSEPVFPTASVYDYSFFQIPKAHYNKHQSLPEAQDMYPHSAFHKNGILQEVPEASDASP